MSGKQKSKTTTKSDCLCDTACVVSNGSLEGKGIKSSGIHSCTRSVLNAGPELGTPLPGYGSLLVVFLEEPVWVFHAIAGTSRDRQLKAITSAILCLSRRHKPPLDSNGRGEQRLLLTVS